MIGYPHNSSNRCQDPKNRKTELKTKDDRDKMRRSSGLGIGSKRKQKKKKKKKEKKKKKKSLPCFCSVSCAQLFVHARTRRWAVRHIMSGRAYESSLSMSRLVYRLKTSAVLWQCGWSGTNTPPDEGGQNYLHLASWRSANCTGSV